MLRPLTDGPGPTSTQRAALTEPSAGIASAAANWVWLAPSASFDRAIHIGEPGGVLSRALGFQMGRLEEFAAPDWRRALSAGHADWVVLDLDQLRGAGVAVSAVLPLARAALGGGGTLCLIANADRSLAGRVRSALGMAAAARAAGRAGFREVRRYFAVPSTHAPRSFVPARRAAAIAFEAAQAAQTARRDRLALARLGLDPALYRGHICLCTA